MLVLGTHGRSGFEHLVLGSVAEKVVRKAKCPVMTIPRAAPDAAQAVPGLFHQIIAGVDFSDASLHALKHALSLAQEADAHLTVLRVVEVPRALLHSLKVWRLKCPKGEHDLVFPNREGNPMDAANLIHRGFEPAVRRAGLRKIRFHDLRHTAASLLLANGVDVVAVSRLLGHSSPIVTLTVYSHAIPRERQGLTDKLSAILSSKPVANLNKTEIDDEDIDRNLLSGLVGRAGVEPATNGLKVQCSTN